ncbi:MAG: transglutaminase domain-containing protein [Oscillospiraceae bacterium]|nr:transglutaminase domain-containing protein [Oscillospiraceae bacterium]
MKKTLRIFMLIFCVAFLLSGCLSSELMEEWALESESRAESRAKETLTEEEIRAIEYEFSDVMTLLDEFDANEIAAKKKYDGKAIRATGIVSGIGENIASEVYITIDDGEVWFNSLYCIFKAESEINKVALLKKGDTITVVGVLRAGTMDPDLIYSSIEDMPGTNGSSESNSSEVSPDSTADQGAMTPPSEEEICNISDSTDLFFILQDALYTFSPEVYISAEDYSQFTKYWDELLDEVVLNSAFQNGQVYIEYYGSSPCNIRLMFSYNATGIVLQSVLQDAAPVFETDEADELYTELIEISEQIFKKGMSDYEKVVAAHGYIVEHAVYSTEGNAEYLATAHSVLVDGKGQGQGYSEAFAALLIISGVETKVVSGMALDSTGVNYPHAWNMVSIDEVWYHVDVIWDDPIPDTGKEVTRTFLCRSDDFFEIDHTWSDVLPRCPSDYPVE